MLTLIVLQACSITLDACFLIESGWAAMIDSSSSLTMGRCSYMGWALTRATRFMLTGPLSSCSSTWFMSTFSESVSSFQ